MHRVGFGMIEKAPGTESNLIDLGKLARTCVFLCLTKMLQPLMGLVLLLMVGDLLNIEGLKY